MVRSPSVRLPVRLFPWRRPVSQRLDAAASTLFGLCGKDPGRFSKELVFIARAFAAMGKPGTSGTASLGAKMRWELKSGDKKTDEHILMPTSRNTNVK
ncbi:MAG: hypothetical protein LBT97_10720, partial [Planctomycetota bacterium]|nr:hypothetical protein [Planctomycetota bacterium]